VENAPATSEKNVSNATLAQVFKASAAIDSEAALATSVVPVTAQATAAGSALGETWSDTVNQLVASEAVAALTRELALQSELQSQAGGVWTLRVERESLSQPAAREKLQAALQQLLGDAAFKLVVDIGPVTDTPAKRNAAVLAERQRVAEEAIHNNPYMQDMIRNWGAKIVPGSIKPLAAGPI
jgi:DNA polymerase-3 subunit gamma/tau